MGIDGRSAGLQPNSRRFGRLCNRLADQARGTHSRLDDSAAIRGVIAAVDTGSCQVDHGIGARKLRSPRARRFAVPSYDPPWQFNLQTILRSSTEDDHIVAAAGERSGQNGSYLPAAAWDHDSHWPLLAQTVAADASTARQESGLIAAGVGGKRRAERVVL
jgi:hypothetical protein